MRTRHGPGARRARTLLLAASALSVAACGAAGDTVTSIDPPAPTADLSLAVDAVVLRPGDTQQASIAVARSGGAGALTLTAHGVPAGVTATLEPAVLPTTASASRLTLSASAAAASGTYTVTVRASGSGIAPAAAAVALTIDPPPAAEPPPVVPAPVEPAPPAPPPPAPPQPAEPPAAASLHGIYLGLRVSGVTGKQYQDYWTFLPDGRVLDVDPYEGLDRPLDMAVLCERHTCGTYVRVGDELRISWAGADAKLYDIDATGAFNERGRTQKYRPVDPLNDLRLDATFAEFNADVGRTMVRLRLGADGRFEEERLMHYTAWAQLGGPGETRVEREGGSGEYTIRRNTLALRYADGVTAYFTIVVPPGEIGKAVPDVIHVNSAPIARAP